MYTDKIFCVPGVDLCIEPGVHVKLGKFDSETWTVGYGWYSWGGNRPVCGWYLTSDTSGILKPLQKPDIDDIYLIEM